MIREDGEIHSIDTFTDPSNPVRFLRGRRDAGGRIERVHGPRRNYRSRYSFFNYCSRIRGGIPRAVESGWYSRTSERDESNRMFRGKFSSTRIIPGERVYASELEHRKAIVAVGESKFQIREGGKFQPELGKWKKTEMIIISRRT